MNYKREGRIHSRFRGGAWRDGGKPPQCQRDSEILFLHPSFHVSDRRPNWTICAASAAAASHARRLAAGRGGAFGAAFRGAAAHVLAILVATAGMFWTAEADAQPQTIPCPDGAAEAIDPFIPLASLKTVANPVLPGGALRPDLARYIRDKDAAIRLGKALFWDVQASSDNMVSCATCHFHAGADPRVANQLHPGYNKYFDVAEPNAVLQASDFPFTDVGASLDRDDIAGSQGIRKRRFAGVGANGAELTGPLADSVFRKDGKNVRQVTDKHSASTINAVFNHRNFWNGRAQAEFNANNPFGDRDWYSKVWVLGLKGTPVPVDIHVANASLASQAVGPPLNTAEMSAIGRQFPDIGRKLLRLKPLGLQEVSPADSALGPLADSGKGLTTTYSDLIQQAFEPRWWNSSLNIQVGSRPYSMMEANFALYWGLSIMLYEATLVADDTPIDQYLDSGRANPAVLDGVVARLNAEGHSITRDNMLAGLSLFETPVESGGAGCIGCHGGAELTLASMTSVLNQLPDNDELPDDDNPIRRDMRINNRLERMFMRFPATPPNTTSLTFDPETYEVTATLADESVEAVPVAVYDVGFYDIGVRPAAEDAGLGGLDPFKNPLSFARLFQRSLLPEAILVPGDRLTCGATEQTLLSLTGPLKAAERAAVDGSFKTPGLRNVELSAPYFHNGGKSTLGQVMEFYDIGSDFPQNPNLAPLIMPMNFSEEDTKSLIAFLLALTDERVRWQRAPFDHPELYVPVGQDAAGADLLDRLPAVGAEGASAPLGRFLDLDPFAP